MRIPVWSFLFCTAVFQGPLMMSCAVTVRSTQRYDVAVYGATSAGVAAAVQAARQGNTVVLIEPGSRVGGLSSGGLGATDIGNKAVIGGLSREFYRRVRAHYDRDDAWVQQRREDFKGRGHRPNEDAAWTFEPKVAMAIFDELLIDAGVRVVFGERLERPAGAAMAGQEIAHLRMVSGLEVTARVFIDATYEGDLLAAAGVSYTVGREANDRYGETLNGVQTARAIHHQFTHPVDGYVIPGNPDSGLLPGIGDGPGPEGGGDHRVQAYCFRLCATDAPENRLPWPKPEDYDERNYELLLRNFDAGDRRRPWHPVAMPNRKTDSNNNFAVSTDFIGGNYDYPEADYAERERIVAAHRSWQQGLMWTLANHPRVPSAIREYYGGWGLCRDEFVDSDHWPPQLYVREARRMVSDLVMTELHCRGTELVEDSVGMGAYGMDSHHVQRFVTEDGTVLNEGDVQVHGFEPYPIAYRSIVPARAECSNLLVPVCMSASHIAYGSIRMEPVFMVLGQSAAIAAGVALERGCAVQDVPYAELRPRLSRAGQVLEWNARGTARVGVDPATLPGIVRDDDDAELTGPWVPSTSVQPYLGNGYWHDGNAGKGRLRAAFTLEVPAVATYEVRVAFTPHGNRASNVPVNVRSTAGSIEHRLDQRAPPEHGMWTSLGRFEFGPDAPAMVTIGNTGTDGYVVIDGVQLLPVN